MLKRQTMFYYNIILAQNNGLIDVHFFQRGIMNSGALLP